MFVYCLLFNPCEWTTASSIMTLVRCVLIIFDWFLDKKKKRNINKKIVTRFSHNNRLDIMILCINLS